MIYLVQVIIYTALLYGIYLLCLRNKAIHAFNRGYLLLTAVVPLLLPLIRLPGISRIVDKQTTVYTAWLPVFDMGNGIRHLQNGFIDEQLFVTGYWVISLALVLRLFYRHVKLYRFIHRQQREPWQDAVLVCNTGMAPGSWMHYIFLPGAQTDDAILMHEYMHVRRKHSLDIVLIQCLQALYWPNVLLRLVMRELRMVHEFQADATAGDEATYARLLLNQSFYTNQFSIVHTFFHHPLKRRIMMLYKKQQQSGRSRVLAIILAGAVMGTVTAVQSCNKQTDQSGASGKRITRNAPSEDVPTTIAVMPEFPGGQAALMNFMGQNLQYPSEAKTAHIEGRVVVKFVVKEDGNVSDAVIVSSPDQLLSDAALDVVHKMPVWKPGADEKGNPAKVTFTLPVLFKL